MTLLTQNVAIAFSANTSPLARVVNHVSRLERGLNSMNRQLNANSAAMSRNARNAKKFSDQGLANIQAGLVQLSTYMMLFNQRLDDMFDKATNRFAGVDEALTQLRITMGMTGERSIDMLRGMTPKDETLSQYDLVTERMADLAKSTQFTNQELVKASDEFARTGRTARESIILTDLARQLSAASAGAIDLAGAVTMVNNSIFAFGGDVDRVSTSLDRMVKASQTLNMGLPDVREGFKSLGGALSNLSNQSGDADAFFLMMLAGFKSLGKSPRESAQAIKSSLQSTLTVFSRVDKAFLKARNNISEALSVFKGARVMRNEGRNALLTMLGLTGDANAQVEKRAQDLAAKYKIAVSAPLRELARESLAREMLAGPEGKLDPRSFVKLLESARKNLEKTSGTETEVMSRLSKAFGSQALPTFMKALKLVSKDSDEFGRKMDGLINSYGTLQNAADESLKSLSSKLKLAESAEDALSIAIMREDVAAKGALGTYTKLVNATSDFLSNNQKAAQSVAALGRSLQFLTEIGTHLGFALVAMATFSIGATYAFKGTSMAALSLGRIMAGFYSIFLAPTLAILLKMAGAAALLSLAFVGLVRRLTGARSVSEGMIKVFDTLNDKISIFQGFLGLYNKNIRMTTEDMEAQVKTSEEIAKLEQKRLVITEKLKKGGLQASEVDRLRTSYTALTDQIAGLDNQRQSFLKAFGVESLGAFKNLDEYSRKKVSDTAQQLANIVRIVSSFVEGVIEPLGVALEYSFSIVGAVAKIILSPLTFLLRIFGLIDSESNLLAQTFGFMLGLFLAFKFVVSGVIGGLTFLATKLGGIFTGALRVRQSIMALNTEMRKEREYLTGVAYSSSQVEVAARKKAIAYMVLRGRLGLALRGYRSLNQELERNMRLQAAGLPDDFMGPIPRYHRQIMPDLTTRPDRSRPTLGERVYRGVNADAADETRRAFGGVGASAQAAGQHIQNKLNTRLAKYSGIALGAVAVTDILSQTMGVQNETFSTFMNVAYGLTAIIPMLTGVMGLFQLGLVPLIATVWGFVWPLLAVAAAIGAVYYAYKSLTGSSKEKPMGVPSSGSSLSSSKAAPTVAQVKPASVMTPRAMSMPAMGSAVAQKETSAISAREVNIHIHERVESGDAFANRVRQVVKDQQMQVIV